MLTCPSADGCASARTIRRRGSLLHCPRGISIQRGSFLRRPSPTIVRGGALVIGGRRRIGRRRALGVARSATIEGRRTLNVAPRGMMQDALELLLRRGAQRSRPSKSPKVRREVSARRGEGRIRRGEARIRRRATMHGPWVVRIVRGAKTVGRAAAITR
jgi:hypothetical protein